MNYNLLVNNVEEGQRSNTYYSRIVYKVFDGFSPNKYYIVPVCELGGLSADLGNAYNGNKHGGEVYSKLHR